MNDILVTDFPIARLGYAFRSMGLPLIAKTTEQWPTTSILIRGGAGAGKTTLGVALAHAMARDTEGTALYLATEFVATEVLYKARMLGLPDGLVATFDESGPFEAGVLLAEHLLRTDAGAGVQTSLERKRAAIGAVWELIRPGQGDDGGEESRAALANVRVVVIDAFGLPDSEAEEKELRDEFLSLVQTLEYHGISVVVVEEKSQSSTHWLPFVVDIVFEIQMLADPDTGELLRKLTCPKSRYATSVPGPHDYELDHEGRPCVWPDPLSVPAERLQRIREQVASPGFFFPTGGGQFITSSGASDTGRILLATLTERRALTAVRYTADLDMCQVDCGPTTMISGPALDQPQIIKAQQGPHALGWTLLDWAEAGRIRAVVFCSLDYFLSRVRFRVAIGHVLDALRHAGLIVVVQGRAEELEALVPLTDYVADRYIRRHLEFESYSTLRSPVHWLPLMQRDAAVTRAAEFWERVLGQPAHGEHRNTDVEQSMLHLLLGLARGKHSLRASCESIKVVRQTIVVLSSPLELLFRWHAHLTDGPIDYREVGRAPLSPADDIRAALLTARDIVAGARILSLMSQQPEQLERYLPYWHALCALHGRNRAALAQVEDHLAGQHSVLLYGLHLRALAAHRMHEPLERELTRLIDEQDIPSWYAARIRVESRLEAIDLEPSELDAIIQAINDLLAEHGPNMPEVHRAEVLYNLGIAHERRGQTDEARTSFQAALDINPHLEPARAHLSPAE